MPAKKVSSTRPNTLENFMHKVTKLNISDNAIDDFIRALDDLVTRITKQSAKLATGHDRKTIMPADLAKALDEILRRGPLSVDELLKKIKPLTVVELSELSKAIKKMAQDLLKPRPAGRQREKTRRRK